MKVIRILMYIVLGGSAVKGVSVLVRTSSMDYQVFAAAELVWLLYVLVAAMFFCQLTGMLWIYRPFRGGFVAALGAVGLNLIETLIGVGLAVGNPEMVKQAYVTSREARGLPVRPEMMEMMEGGVLLWVPVGIAVPAALLWVALLYSIHRDHQKRGGAGSTEV
jgi:hypothetical protein